MSDRYFTIYQKQFTIDLMKLFQTHYNQPISLIFASFIAIFLILVFSGCSKIQDEKTKIKNMAVNEANINVI